MPKVHIQAKFDEPIQNVKHIYIGLDEFMHVSYEINNKGHIPMPPPFSWKHWNPFNIEKYMPKHMVAKSKSKRRVIGVIQLQINQTKHHNFATVRGLGIIDSFKGNRNRALNQLIKSSEHVLKTQNVEFVEAGTRTIPDTVMKRWGFEKAKGSFMQGITHKLFGQTYYRKYF